MNKSAQEVFDTTLTHLRRQGAPAITGDLCCYRTASGLSCAVGCHIPDSDYNKSFEGTNLITDPEVFLNDVPLQLLWGVLKKNDLEPHLFLLVAMQNAHDTDITYINNRDDWANLWEKKMMLIAKKFKLNYTKRVH